MNDAAILDHNRVILSHFDSYSAALVFARNGNSILSPAPLPESASLIDPPGETSAQHDPAAVMSALTAQLGLDPALMATGKLSLDKEFDVWMSSENGPIRIHLARFSTPDAPREAIEPLGAVFKPISDMRGLPMTELNLLRQVFNLTLGN
jgi:hypothetical protein